MTPGVVPDFNKMLCVDFDGTLCAVAEYPAIGEPNIRLINTLIRMRLAGYLVFLWTVRFGPPLDDAVAWAKEYGLEFDGINQNPFNGADQYQRKVYATHYIDDRAITPEDFIKKFDAEADLSR